MSNIIGEQLDPYVISQISIRQEAQGGGVDSERTLDQLAYLNSRTSWIKLASSVSVSKKVLEDINLSTFKADLKNKGLAENNVLFGGTSILQDKSLSPIEDSSTLFNTVRSSGMSGYENSSDYGVIPMAGIESVDVKTLNRGSIEKANIKIKAYSKEQFNIIETLYLRLGYTVLLEWGNSSYLKNDGTVGNVNSTLVEDPDGFFKKEKYDDPQRIYSSIDNLREEHGGNYDAMLGKISNFSWSFEKDGSFDITITLISLGDVIESLKINVNPSRTVKEFISPLKISNPDGDAVDKNKNANSISSMLWLYKYVNYNISTSTPIAIVDGAGTQHGMGNWCARESTSGGVEGFEITIYKIYYDRFKNPMNNQPRYSPTFYGFSSTSPIEDFEVTDVDLEEKYASINVPKIKTKTINTNDYAAIKKVLEDVKPSPINKKWCYIYTVKKVEILAEENPLNIFSYKSAFYLDTLNTPSFYLRFGELLDFINNRVISKISTNSTPHSSNTKLISIDTGQYTNKMYAVSDMISLDPRVCLIRNNSFEKGPGRGVAKVFEQLPPFLGVDYRSVGGKNYGYIMNIYLNFDFILESLNSNTDDKGSVALLPFLTSICDKVSEALGGINNLEPVIDKNNSGLKIIDSTPIPGLIQDGLKKIEVFGYNSNNSSNFVRNIDLKTAITPEYATMITVGATAGGYVKGTDATAFSKWNAGLTDRFKQDLLPAVIPNDDDPSAEDKDPEKVYEEDFLGGILKCYGFKIGGGSGGADPTSPPGRNWTDIEMHESYIKSNLSVATEYYKYLHSKNKNTTGGTTGFIPFKLSLTVDGISGVKIYNKLEVDTRFLPVNYGNTLNFIVTGVSHKLNNNDWETQIETTVMPKTEVLEMQSTVSSSAYGGGSGGSSVSNWTDLPPSPRVVPKGKINSTSTEANAADYIIDYLEGGYYHPTHAFSAATQTITPGFVIMKDSGETIYGLDRVAGGWMDYSKGKQFWEKIDTLSGNGGLSNLNSIKRTNVFPYYPRQSNSWNYNEVPRANPSLRLDAKAMIKERYDRYSTDYFGNHPSRSLMESDGRGIFMFYRAVWNGSGYFQNYANNVKAKYDSGVTNIQDLIGEDLKFRYNTKAPAFKKGVLYLRDAMVGF